MTPPPTKYWTYSEFPIDTEVLVHVGWLTIFVGAGLLPPFVLVGFAELLVEEVSAAELVDAAEEVDELTCFVLVFFGLSVLEDDDDDEDEEEEELCLTGFPALVDDEDVGSAEEVDLPGLDGFLDDVDSGGLASQATQWRLEYTKPVLVSVESSFICLRSLL